MTIPPANWTDAVTRKAYWRRKRGGFYRGGHHSCDPYRHMRGEWGQERQEDWEDFSALGFQAGHCAKHPTCDFPLHFPKDMVRLEADHEGHLDAKRHC